MGICSSRDTADVATAKLILHDGRLMEFSSPVKAAYVLQKNPMYFICNSEHMGFDEAVSAINADEELQLGRLYFVLPLHRLRHPLDPAEMAALAVKATSALTRNAGAGERLSSRRRIVGDGFGRRIPTGCDAAGAVEKFRRREIVAGDGGIGGGSRRRGGSIGKRKKFTSRLSMIEE